MPEVTVVGNMVFINDGCAVNLNHVSAMYRKQIKSEDEEPNLYWFSVQDTTGSNNFSWGKFTEEEVKDIIRQIKVQLLEQQERRYEAKEKLQSAVERIEPEPEDIILD